MGSSFFFDLPLPAYMPADAEVPVLTAVTPLPVLRVLVAEDNPINQKVICSIVGRQGWTATLALNGVEACQKLQPAAFDLVLMDIQMPEMDGLAAARRIREMESEWGTDNIPILALTAHASEVQRQQCLEAGMDGVVTKPVTLRSLLEAIRGVVKVGAGDSRSP